MGFNVQPRRIILLTCLLALFGCTTPKPAPTTKTEPTVAALPPPKPAPPTSPITPPVVTKPPPAPAVLTLSDGPWKECAAEQASIAIVVTVHTNGLFRDRVGIHYLQPAQKTTYRLVLLRSNTPVTLAQKEIPEACSSSFHLANDEYDTAGTNYSIHSTLKQIPVDSTRAITLNLRVNCHQNGPTEHIDESVVLNGLSRTECGKGAISASVEILTPENAAQRIATASDSASSSAKSPSSTAESGAAQSDWDLLHKKFQLTGQETRSSRGFQLTGDASIQFPDIRFASEQIEISNDHSLMILRGPVRIDWDGRSMTADDAVIHVGPDTVQFESSNIQAN